ncbi:DNA-directed RNA polymerase V subunit 5A [Capsicum baccatum]|uniref:DNA-directed RNA polymerase V subunit 5A n=2 Tax=Capsicum TaxID=4071 RepID=A0A1U8GKX3_CAPAN|nr:DNA-directed RNA polymerase V subunit 5A [Capsicum annuum]PHT54547.1 DNA-directed RNA polymerase V subunit 5A [Capsicum baccatum]PHU16681.1 DNA-directed RNA polymerase V subunit 5A [Capsicum chinense]KAF3656625.1 DNA-directed RNA polymerase V subunit 5A [Capsicum annuum]KAF3660422.1 DNA-directed RNA polymerase V subunit 5A [Capsicum annuum]PHT80564.1 DNA-directed RNA polymerase V subunit 5A [Capsicum annuum]
MDLNGSAMEIDEQHLGPCLSSYVNAGSVESHRYFLGRRTILEMLKDRGFAIPNSEIDTTLEEFREKYGQSPDVERLRISAMHRNDLTNKVLVIFCGPNTVKLNAIRAILTQIMNKESLSRLILVIQSQMTSQAMKAVENMSFKVEIFQITDLLVNITKHVLKPRHELLTNTEKKKLLEKYNLEEKQLPRMSQKDPIARYYGLEKGQVVKVTYNSEIIETHVTYRCVW